MLLSGLAIYMVHAAKASDAGAELLALVDATDVGYVHYASVFEGSYGTTCGFVAGCILASAFLALTRMHQKRAHSDRRREPWGRYTYTTLRVLSVLALLVIVMPVLWFLLNCMFLSGWGFGMWTLRDAAEAASINMARWSAAGGKAPDGVVKAQDMVCPTREWARLNLCSELQRCAPNHFSPTFPPAARAEACFNLAYFAWLESGACLCTQALVVDLQDAAAAALYSIVWALGGVGCLWAGAMVAAVQGAADVALIAADWQWMEILKKRIQASLAPSPARRQPSAFREPPFEKPQNPTTGGGGGGQLPYGAAYAQYNTNEFRYGGTPASAIRRNNSHANGGTGGGYGNGNGYGTGSFDD